MGKRMRVGWTTALLLGTLAFAFPGDAAHGAGPHLSSVTTADLFSDGQPMADGRIDTLILDFDEDIEEATFHAADLTVAGWTVIGYEQIQPRRIHLWLQEVGFDTGEAPSVMMAEGRIRSTGGGAVAQWVGTAADGAAPVLVSATALSGSDAVRLRFSEPLPSVPAATDFAYQDTAAGGASSIVSVDAGADPRTFIATLDAPVTEGDLDTDSVTPKNTVQDGAGNVASPKSRPLSSPRLMEVRADIGSKEVVARFNSPVQGSSGAIGASAFDIVYDAPPATPITGVASVRHTDGADVFVTLLDPVGSDDVRSLEPALLTLASGLIMDTAGNPVPFASVPLHDPTPPRPVGVFSEDRNRNGFLDAVSVLWSEPVTPVCIDGLEVEGFELDLQSNQLPIISPDGFKATLPIKEHATQAPDTGALPSFISRTCSGSAAPWTDRADPPNPARAVGRGAIDEVDGAHPVVVSGTTADVDRDGRLDHYSLRFSESMDATAFDPARWQVVGHKVLAGVWSDAETLDIQFAERATGSTGDRPAINYTGSTITDLAGNALLAFQGGGFEKIDGARPQVLDAFGDEGSTVLHIVFSEGVEGVSDPNDPSGPGRGLQEKDFSFTNGGGGNAGIVNVLHNKGDREVLLITASPLEAVDFGPGGDQVRPLPGQVRESNGKDATARLTVDQTVITFVERDVLVPGTPTGMSWEVDQTTATLTFTADWDDAGDDASGPATGYHLVIADEELGDLTGKAVAALDAWSTVALDPEPPAAGEAEQKLVATGLCPGRPYFAALVALDEDANPSAAALPGGFTTLPDTTAPVGTFRFFSTTHPVVEGNATETAKLAGKLAWDELTDPESCDIAYHWVIDDQPDGVASIQDELADGPGVNFTIAKDIPLPAELYIHVAAANDQGVISESGHHALLIVPPTDCDAVNITARDLTAVREGGFTTLSWRNIEKELPEGVDLLGYQVWFRKSDSSSWVLRDLLEPPFSGFETLKYIDDAKAGEGSSFLVTAYFTEGLCQVAVDENSLSQRDFSNFDAAMTEVIRPPPRIPTWAWVTLAALSLLIFGGVIVFFGARRTKLDESWLEDEPEEDHGDPFGPDPMQDLAAGEAPVEDDPFAPPRAEGAAATAPAMGSGSAPSLDISCPACTHNFQVQGHRPLQIRCPNCSASGVLE